MSNILQSLGKGSIVIFQNDPQTYYFKNNKDGKTGFFLDKNDQPKLKPYSKIKKINSKLVNEILNPSTVDYSNLKPSSDFKNYDNVFDFSFQEGNKNVKVILSFNPVVSLESLDKIFGTNYEEDYHDFMQEDENYITDKQGYNSGLDNSKFIKSLPQTMQRCGEIGFDVDGHGDTTKLRNQKKNYNLKKLEEFEKENDHLIKYITQRGYVKLGSNENPKELNQFINNDPEVKKQLNNWENLKRWVKENPTTEETPDIKTYLRIISKVAGISIKFVEKYKPSIMIFNHPSGDIPEEVSQKRNQIYKQFIQKILISGYQVKEKSGVLYIEKQGLNEIKVNKPSQPINASYFKDNNGHFFIDVYDMPTYGRFNTDKSKIMFTLSGIEYDDILPEIKNLLKKRNIPFEFVEAGFHDGVFYIDSKYFILKNELEEIKVNKPTSYTKEYALELWNELMKEYKLYFRTEERRSPDPHSFIENKPYTEFVISQISGKDVKEEKWVNILSKNDELFKDYIKDLLKLKQIWKEKYNKDMKENIKQVLKEELNNIINQNKQEVLTFEENPLEFIIQKYPSLNKTLEDLLTDKYRDYITGIFIVAPKPTLFKIILHNGQFFYLTYAKQGYIAKVSGKQYFLMNLKEEEYAIKGISNLLMMGMPPSSEGPGEEAETQDGIDNNFVADMQSEPGGDNLDLDGIDTDGETPPEGEDNTEEEPIKETKEKRYRIISEIKVEKPSKYIIGNRYNVDHDYGDDVIFKGEKFRKGSNWYEFENTEEEVTLWIPKK